MTKYSGVPSLSILSGKQPVMESEGCVPGLETTHLLVRRWGIGLLPSLTSHRLAGTKSHPQSTDTQESSLDRLP